VQTWGGGRREDTEAKLLTTILVLSLSFDQQDSRTRGFKSIPWEIEPL
jgi:hypothetical protein